MTNITDTWFPSRINYSIWLAFRRNFHFVQVCQRSHITINGNVDQIQDISTFARRLSRKRFFVSFIPATTMTFGHNVNLSHHENFCKLKARSIKEIDTIWYSIWYALWMDKWSVHREGLSKLKYLGNTPVSISHSEKWKLLYMNYLNNDFSHIRQGIEVWTNTDLMPVQWFKLYQS